MRDQARRDTRLLAAAHEEAIAGANEGGVPVGAVLAASDGAILARGRNRFVQDASVILHAETDAIERAGQLDAATYAGATLYTTLSPCLMCAGAVLFAGIGRVIAGDCRHFVGGRSLLEGHGVPFVDAESDACFDTLEAWIQRHRALWEENAGAADRRMGHRTRSVNTSAR